MPVAYYASILHSISPSQIEFHANAFLVVGDNGRIEEILSESEYSARKREIQIVDWQGKLIIPGLVDAHMHIPQIDIIGIESEHLIDWLRDHIFAEEIANEDPDIARDRAKRSFYNMLESGTTACAAYSSRHTLATDIAFEEAQNAGIRAWIGKVLMDREAPAELLEEANGALDDCSKLIKKWSGQGNGKLEFAITPRFGITCTEELLDGAGKLAAKSGCPVQTHLSENKGELEAIAALFPHRPDYTSVYENTGLLRENTLLAHCIHLSGGELHRIASSGSCSVYCPDSNFFLHSGRFDLKKNLDHGITVALGSDVGAGTSFSMFDAMKMGNYMQTYQVDPYLLFYLATMGGAKALRWENEIGNFESGKSADFVVMDPSHILRGKSICEREELELLSILIHRGHQAQIEEVYIEGKRVYQHSES